MDILLSTHAEQRCQQRAFSKDKLALIEGLGIQIPQKGGTTLVTFSCSNINYYISVLKEALQSLNGLEPKILGKKVWKKKIRTLKQVIDALCKKHMPYFVKSDMDGVIITCGYLNSRAKRNY